MKGLTNDFIAIDTNVFGHLINNEINADCHIHKLLRAPTEGEDEIKLLIDTGGEIIKEYGYHLRPKYLEVSERLDEAQILKYWMLYVSKEKTVVDKTGLLWRTISEVLPESGEETDRIFVYIAFKKERILISV